MLRAITTSQFEKDIKLAKKRGKDLSKIFKIMRMLLSEEKLPIKHRDHALIGNYVNRRECHIDLTWSSICTHPVKPLFSFFATLFQIGLDSYNRDMNASDSSYKTWKYN